MKKRSNKFLKNLTFTIAYLLLAIGVVCLIGYNWSGSSLMLATGYVTAICGVVLIVALDWFNERKESKYS